MPSLFVHLHTARKTAIDRPDLLASADYYLGSAAPDAILTRPGAGVPEHHASHLLSEKENWEKDVLEIWRGCDRSDPFCIGYIVHVLTDSRMEQYVGDYLRVRSLPSDWQNPVYQRMTRFLDRKMFQHIPDYPELAGFAASARPEVLPFGLTQEDLDNERQLMLREFDGLHYAQPYPDCAELPFAAYLDMTHQTAQDIQTLMGL